MALPSEKTRFNADYGQENFKVDIFKAEKTGKLRKFTEAVFLRWKSVPQSAAATRQVANRKKYHNCRKSKTPGALIYNVPGSRSGGIRTRGLLVPNQTRYQTALHLDTGADEGTRTPDLLITNRLLYQLSHIGTTSNGYYNKGPFVCPALFFTGSGHPQTGVIGYTAT